MNFFRKRGGGLTDFIPLFIFFKHPSTPFKHPSKSYLSFAPFYVVISQKIFNLSGGGFPKHTCYFQTSVGKIIVWRIYAGQKLNICWLLFQEQSTGGLLCLLPPHQTLPPVLSGQSRVAVCGVRCIICTIFLNIVKKSHR